MNQEVQEVRKKMDEGTKRIKENVITLKDEPFTNSEDQSTVDSTIKLESPSEIVNNKMGIEESESIIHTKIARQDAEFDSQKTVSVIAERMIQWVNITDNINAKFEPNKEYDGQQMFAYESDKQESKETDIDNVDDTMNQEKGGLVMKEENIETDVRNVNDTMTQEKNCLVNERSKDRYG